MRLLEVLKSVLIGFELIKNIKLEVKIKDHEPTYEVLLTLLGKFRA